MISVSVKTIAKESKKTINNYFKCYATYRYQQHNKYGIVDRYMINQINT